MAGAWKEVLDESQKGVNGGIATLDSNGKVNHPISNAKVEGLSTLLASKVDNTVKINGHSLTSDISLSATDVGARSSSWTPSASDIPALDASKITTGSLSADRIPTLSQSKISGLTSSLASKVDTSTKINGVSLTGDISLKTSNLIRTVTSLPSSGTQGEMVNLNNKIYVWKDA